MNLRNVMGGYVNFTTARIQTAVVSRVGLKGDFLLRDDYDFVRVRTSGGACSFFECSHPTCPGGG